TTMPPFTDRFTATTPRLAAGAAARFTLVLRATDYPGNFDGSLRSFDRAGVLTPTPGDSNTHIAEGFVPMAVADVTVSVTGAPVSVGLGQHIPSGSPAHTLGPSDARAAPRAVPLPAGVPFGSATTSRFLAQIYSDLLGRPIDSPALERYSKALAAGTANRLQ